MKRTYRISVTVEATASRKLRSRQHARAISGMVSRALEEFKMEGGWKVVGAKVTSRAVSEAAPKPRLLDPSEPLRDAILLRLQVHADGMARLLGNVKKPRLRRFPNPKCSDGMRHARAHGHTHNGRLYKYNPKTKRWDIPLGNLYGMICIRDRFLDSVADGHDDGIRLLAHEVAHLRTPSKTHTKVHHLNTEELERQYREVLAGTRSLPAKPSFPGKTPTGDSFFTRWERVIKNPPGREASLSAPATDPAVRESPCSASSLSMVSSDGDNDRATRPAGLAGAGWRPPENRGPGEAQADEPASGGSD